MGYLEVGEGTAERSGSTRVWLRRHVGFVRQDRKENSKEGEYTVCL